MEILSSCKGKAARINILDVELQSTGTSRHITQLGRDKGFDVAVYHSCHLLLWIIINGDC